MMITFSITHRDIMPLDVTYMTLDIPLAGKMLTFLTCRGEDVTVDQETEGGINAKGIYFEMIFCDCLFSGGVECSGFRLERLCVDCSGDDGSCKYKKRTK